jgi:hypothetical protein
LAAFSYNYKDGGFAMTKLKQSKYEVRESVPRKVAKDMKVELNLPAVAKQRIQINWQLVSAIVLLNVVTTFLLMKMYMRPQNQIELSKMEVQQIIKDAVREGTYFDNQNMVLSATEASKRDFRDFKKEVMGEIKKIYIDHKRELAQNEERWERKLNAKEVVEIKNQLERETSRKIASNENMVPYTDANMDILRYKHRQEYETLRDKLDLKKELFLKSLNLANPNERDMWQQYQDKIDLQLYTLRRKHREIEKDFRVKKYRLLVRK